MTRQEQMLEAFVAFDQSRPEIWHLLCEYAAQVKAAGLEHYGVAAIFERIRWHRVVEKGELDYSLNNNFRAYYARLWLVAHPESPYFFEIRIQRSRDRRARRDEPGPDPQTSLLDLIEQGDVVVERLRAILLAKGG